MTQEIEDAPAGPRKATDALSIGVSGLRTDNVLPSRGVSAPLARDGNWKNEAWMAGIAGQHNLHFSVRMVGNLVLGMDIVMLVQNQTVGVLITGMPLLALGPLYTG